MPNVPYPLRGGDFRDYAIRAREIASKGKFWEVVTRNLKAVLASDAKNQDCRVYFAGWTLCIDGKNALYMLHITGRGSVSRNSPQPLFKKSKVYQPDFITQLVQEVYLQSKGGEEYYPYFKENCKDIAWV